MRLVLCGYYGFGNFGDELMLLGIIEALRPHRQIREVTLFCRRDVYSDTMYFRDLPFNLRVIPDGLGARIRKVIAIAKADTVVWGGGTCLFEPPEGNPGLRNLFRLVTLTRRLGHRFIFLGIGIGTFATEAGESLGRACLMASPEAYFRDDASLHRALAWGFRAETCFSTCDPAFAAQMAIKRPRSPQHPPRITFSGIFDQDERSAKFYAQQLDRLAHRMGAEVCFLGAHHPPKDDHDFHRRIAAMMTHPYLRFLEWIRPEDFLAELQCSDLHVGMRLHSVIAADLVGTPALAIGYAPKVKAYLMELPGREHLSRYVEPLQPWPDIMPGPPNLAQYFEDATDRFRNTVTQVVHR